MFESLTGLVFFVAVVAVLVRQHKRIGLVERELGALRSLALSNLSPTTLPTQTAAEAAAAASIAARSEAAGPDLLSPPSMEPAGDAAPAALVDAQATGEQPAASAESGPWLAATAAAPATKPQEPVRKKPDIETALGTRWAVWVGGVALALGGVFLIRYTIESGFFGPGVRLIIAALFGLVLVAAGEFIRRTGFRMPAEGFAGAYVPGILTAAGAFTLFGTVYAAHGIYGFIGPALGFTLMGVIGIATIAAALVHGQALAGVGLLGSFLTPVLVSSQSPNPWALFGYLAIVLVATAVIARTRNWAILVSTAFAGTGLWCLAYMVDAPTVDFTVVLFINAVMLATLAFVWLAGKPGAPEDGVARGTDWPSLVPAVFIGLTALALSLDEVMAPAGGDVYGAILIAGLLLIALCRVRALTLLHAAGVVTVLLYPRMALGGSFAFQMMGEKFTIDGFPVLIPTSNAIWIGIGLALAFMTAGFWQARLFAGSARICAACWAGWGVAVPLVTVVALWITFGNLDRDLIYALVAIVLAGLFVAEGEAISRAEIPPLAGGPAVSFALGGAGIALLFAIYMAFGSGMTTALVGAACIVPAYATRLRTYCVLGWLCVGAVIATLFRVAADPTIVGAAFLGTTPVFNWLLVGYGIPALAFGYAAWQLARTTDGRPRLAMEAAAALFSLLTIAMLVRHAMNGGVIDDSTPTLAEQSIYTLIAIGAGAILITLDRRSPSSVFRYGSIAAGVVSAAIVAVQHFVFLNPFFTDESTGRVPVFNLLFLAYLLPAIAAGALAWYARGKRPPWYSAMLALMAALLVFAYATLSVRRLFKGEFIGFWSGMSQLETYSYSALWLAMGVALLVAGIFMKSQILRLASGALIVIAVAKVFLFDMSELEGVLRALSFIGLGAVLIGIGLFYQRMLTMAAKPVSPAQP